jgi:homoserine dehydrogenase
MTTTTTTMNDTTTTSTDIKPYRIGMMGAGTVGGGVYEILMNRYKEGGDGVTEGRAQHQPQRPTIITKLLVRSLEKERDFNIDTNITMILTDSTQFFIDINSNELDIDCFVEVAGGCTLAKDLMIEAIEKYHIPVITANKAALFECNTDFINALSLSSKTSSRMGIEAAVCGGIPIINMLHTAYSGDRITQISGICNGTTNYILSKMVQGYGYESALQEAQKLGYAEADPTADVEGYDVRAKIALMAQLAFGIQIPMDQIPCNGISKITSDHITVVKNHFPEPYTIKLLGNATVKFNNDEKHGTVSVYVTPTLIPIKGNIIANVDGCGNIVQVTSTNLSTCTYLGPGAGRLPTANSIVADIDRARNGTLPNELFPIPLSYKNITLKIDTNYEAKFYIGITIQNPGNGNYETIVSHIEQILEQRKVLTVSYMKYPYSDHLNSSYVTVGTYPMSIVQRACETIKDLFQSAIQSYVYIPILGDMKYVE